MVSQSIRRRFAASNSIGYSGELTLSEYEKTVSADSGQDYVILYGDGQIIDDDRVTFTYSGIITNATYEKSYGRVRFYYGANDSTSTTRQGLVIIEYLKKQVILSVTQLECELYGYRVVSATMADLIGSATFSDLGYYSYPKNSNSMRLCNLTSFTVSFSTRITFKETYTGSYSGGSTFNKSYNIQEDYAQDLSAYGYGYQWYIYPVNSGTGSCYVKNLGGYSGWASSSDESLLNAGLTPHEIVSGKSFFVQMDYTQPVLIEEQNSNKDWYWFLSSSNGKQVVYNENYTGYVKYHFPSASFEVVGSNISGSNNYININGDYASHDFQTPAATLSVHVNNEGIDIQQL